MGVKVRKPSGYKSWCVVIDHENQRRTIAVGTREAAERVKREVEARLSVGDYRLIEESAPATTALKDYAAAWLKEVEFARKPSTAGFYEQYLRLYVLPAFGHLPLDRIERTDIKKFLVDLRERKLSKNTIRLAITTLRAVLSSAIEDGKIKANPAQGLGRFVKSDKAKRQAASLTSAEVNHLLAKGRESLDFQDYALILTALRSGIRQGEIAGLEWSDLHFGEDETSTDRFILVQRSYDRRWSRTMLTPKNHKSRRVDMSRELRRTLLELKAVARDVESKLVFPSATGTPTEMNNFYARVFKPLVKQAGLRPIRFHDLRHTFGSLLIQAGASLAYVRDQMGHSSIQITVDVYGHLVPGAQISFVDKLDSPTCPQESARQPQERHKLSGEAGGEVLWNEWLGGRDSNPDTQIQSLQSYR